MSIALSMGSTVFPLAPDELVLDIAAGLGFEGVDLFAIPEMSRLKPSSILENPDATARAVVDRYQSRGLAVSDFFPHPGGGFANQLAPNRPDPDDQARSRDWFSRMLAFAEAIGAAGMTLMPGVNWDGETPESSLARACEELGWRAQKGLEAGIAISVEPHIQSVADTPGLALRLVAGTPGLRLTVDYSHFIHDGYSDEDCEPLLQHARHVHARAASNSRLQESMRQNTIDFARMTETLRRVAYDGFVCCENIWFAPLGCDDVDNMSETIVLRDVLRAALEGRQPPDPAAVTP